MTRRRDEPVPALNLLSAMLRDRPSLPGALCRDAAPAFDPDELPGECLADHAERLRQARWVCGRCPERSACPSPVRGVARVG